MRRAKKPAINDRKRREDFLGKHKGYCNENRDPQEHYYCVCGAKFEKQWELTKHYRGHFTVRAFDFKMYFLNESRVDPCVCDWYFKKGEMITNEALKSHIQLDHWGEIEDFIKRLIPIEVIYLDDLDLL